MHAVDLFGDMRDTLIRAVLELQTANSPEDIRGESFLPSGYHRTERTHGLNPEWSGTASLSVLRVLRLVCMLDPVGGCGFLKIEHGGPLDNAWNSSLMVTINLAIPVVSRAVLRDFIGQGRIPTPL